MKKIYILIFLAFAFLIQPGNLIASENTACDNRYVTLVNPVRSRDLWIDKSMSPLKKQYDEARKNNLPVTWLLQYDVLADAELLKEIKNFDSSHEIGAFLEISPYFAEKARVIYPHSVPWFSPEAVFLSSYSQSERRKLIDQLFEDFKSEFGFYPKSAGAWWIDSYSLQYMKDRFDIKAVLIVADQKTTDNYGVWGQWWGVPYYPSKANILTPASNGENKQDVVVLQWAQRDPALATGEGPKFSNYSLQANDYIRQGKDTGYFKSLINSYLDCRNPLGQVTVGLETGSDSVTYFEEYARQLKAVKEILSLKPVTMGEFYNKFRGVYPDFPKRVIIEGGGARWEMTPEKRSSSVGDTIFYNPDLSFSDFFIAGKDKFLNRVLPFKSEQSGQNLSIPLSLISLLIIGIYSYFRKKLKVYFSSVFFVLAAFGLILRSGSWFGWQVYFGPVLGQLYLYQIMLPVITFLTFLFLERFKKLNLWFLPLAFAVDPLIQSLRISFISDKYYAGFMLDAFRFVGVSIKNYQIEFINSDFPGYLAAGLLKIDFNKIWQNAPLALIVYPLLHVSLSLIFNIIFVKDFKLKRLIILVLAIFLSMHLLMVFTADPFAVQSVNE
jgi:hypothetical protein